MERALRNGREVGAPAREQLLQSLLALYDDTLAFYDYPLGVRIARKHIAWMIDAEFGVAMREIRKAICTLDDPRRVREALVALFDCAEERAAA
jgi:tRNA-dihydrouridine synthase